MPFPILLLPLPLMVRRQSLIWLESIDRISDDPITWFFPIAKSPTFVGRGPPDSSVASAGWGILRFFIQLMKSDSIFWWGKKPQLG